ncbi:Phage Mu protein F like protein [Sphingopyxis indica]|uniref:Phage Mu protein F like protein n=2 Tax=Sphingopyxis indica TaxID=436663 RepID=A0A239KPS0_9SPHN|nr:Phage Mu protein F like protein [Sphingopyxis indica]
MDDDLLDLIAKLEPALAIAFLAAIASLRAGINYPLLLTALRNGDIDGAIYALNIDRGAFGAYVIERQSAFAQAGATISEALTKDRIAFFKRRDREPSIRSPALPPAELEPVGPSGPLTPAPPAPPTLTAPGGGELHFRFDMTNPRAEARIRTEAAARVTGYVDEQIETARRVIADGFARGDGPQNIATDIAGRINPISGRRQGGIVGLSDPQAGYVDSMRARLLSGDPDEMAKVLGSFDKDGKWKPGTGMTLRDRRYDGAIKRAIAAIAKGKPNPLTRDKIDEMTAKYADRLLARRAEDVARTETAQGVMMARAEATAQALDRDALDDQAVEKTWRHLGGIDDARDTHLAMHGRSVTGLTMPFILPDGSVMQHAHDPAGGAKNNVNCRCGTDFIIDWSWGL